MYYLFKDDKEAFHLGGSSSSGRLLITLGKGEASGGLAVTAVLARTNTDDVGVDGARDTVMVLNVGLGDDVLYKMCLE